MSAIERAFSILEALAHAREGISLSELGKQLHIPKSTLHGVLGTLIEQGYVRQEKSSERYALTMKLPALGIGYLAATEMVNVCQPELDQLAAKVGAVVQLRIVDGDKLVRVAWAQGSRSPLRFTPLWQASDYLHNTAAGNAWLANLSEAEAARLALAQGFPFAETDKRASRGNTPRSLSELFERLRTVREQGYGLNLEDSSPGVTAIAVAIKSADTGDAAVVGTLSIAGPAVELPKERLIELLPDLVATARKLSQVWPIQRFMGAQIQPLG